MICCNPYFGTKKFLSEGLGYFLRTEHSVHCSTVIIPRTTPSFKVLPVSPVFLVLKLHVTFTEKSWANSSLRSNVCEGLSLQKIPIYSLSGFIKSLVWISSINKHFSAVLSSQLLQFFSMGSFLVPAKWIWNYILGKY